MDKIKPSLPIIGAVVIILAGIIYFVGSSSEPDPTPDPPVVEQPDPTPEPPATE